MESKKSVEEHGYEPTIGSEDGLNINSESQQEVKESTQNNNVPSDERVSPEPSCVICLGKPENKSFTDSCFHIFCFACLVEWSKVKAECPLCKQSFRSIIHNVRSLEDYDQYLISVHNVPKSIRSDNSGRRFRYPSTLTSERRRQIRFERSLEFHNYRSTYAPHVTPRTARRERRHHISTSNFRRHIYESGLWVQPLGDGQTGRFRDTSPEFYRQNPACTHRLIPWLNRELVALLGDGGESQLAFLLELVLALIMRFDIRSPEFYEHVRPFFRDRTSHFVHEFFNFARSTYDLINFDRRAVYDIIEQRQDKDNESDNTESDIDVVSIDTNENKPFISVSVSAGSSEPGSNEIIHSNPVAVATIQGVSSLDSFSTRATAYICQTPTPVETNKIKVVGDSESDSDCVVVSYIKSKAERTPEVVDLCSTSDDEQNHKTKVFQECALEGNKGSGQNVSKEKQKSHRSMRSRSYRKCHRKNGRHSSSKESSFYQSSSSDISSYRCNSSRHNTCGSSTQSPTPSLEKSFNDRSRNSHSLSQKKRTPSNSESSGTYSLSFSRRGQHKLKSLVISVKKSASYSCEHKEKHYSSKHKKKHNKSKKPKLHSHHYHHHYSSSNSD
ncbi:E3 ubiquitin-protein ligase Topors-like [Limulus polyphemus]|uniref:RING-type E3 ubiquitin transferase n=1 Tax=Limulus polyphemus TaxID=6850 RepID=A0ABM1T377_LIMPO|nr:E3 ubiquitin-protein ligase Topors-like [Limulus polyphemus]XP_022250333.1 E3 ubiquitin-protein ligase Topors-like [Limulus polyphemus]XP_022250334.1 E3 ubiquitin-protein ligase Topors-like [Limulus polyphemus]XP_022250335.1 E3 ubiquitin-protein ligase Topors-like [Limulus polyphemus]XP_022250336.1 E3 ubiquitin-protein ligase Topors-like [Limulus polyphemus]